MGFNLTIEDIARVCHEANKAYCESIGDHSQKTWEMALDSQRSSAIEGVKTKQKHHMIAPAQLHNLWMQRKTEEGWTYGEAKDMEKKTHPCMKPWKELPVEQRVKDELFLAIAGTLLKAR